MLVYVRHVDDRTTEIDPFILLSLWKLLKFRIIIFHLPCTKYFSSLKIPSPRYNKFQAVEGHNKEDIVDGTNEKV